MHYEPDVNDKAISPLLDDLGKESGFVDCASSPTIPVVEHINGAASFHTLDVSSRDNVGLPDHEMCNASIPSDLSCLSRKSTPAAGIAESSHHSSTVLEVRCSCIECLQVGLPKSKDKRPNKDGLKYPCRFPGCPISDSAPNLREHERSHFAVRTGRNPYGWERKKEHCNVKIYSWYDFRRHYGSKHCTNPVKKCLCPVSWCKYSDTGFARKDKLNSHLKTAHGEKKPGKPNQPLQPKLDASAPAKVDAVEM